MNAPFANVFPTVDEVASRREPGRVVLAGAPDGHDAMVLARLATRRGRHLHVARDDLRLSALAEAVGFFNPEIEVLELPAWDCLPYDRVSPNPAILARRVETLARLSAGDQGRPTLVLTTIASVLQRVPAMETLAEASMALAVGGRLNREDLTRFCERHGYARAEQVMEPGEYAVRGGIVDIFPPGLAEPLRIDLFGDDIDGLRHFDPLTQRTTGKLERALLHPMNEIALDETSIHRFRAGYRQLAGAVTGADPLYEAVSEGRRYPGMEHWLPLFHERLETLFDHLGDGALSLDPDHEPAIDHRLAQIVEYHDTRRTLAAAKEMEGGAVYHPLPPDRLYLSRDEWEARLGERLILPLSPFPPVEGAGSVDCGGRRGRDFADVRAQPGRSVFAALKDHIDGLKTAGTRAVIAATSPGARDRLVSVMGEHGIAPLAEADDWAAARSATDGTVVVTVLGLEHGFTAPGLAVIAEQDLLGERLVRGARRKRRADRIIAEAGTLAEGDLVVHVDHGIGRYEGLETLTAGGAPHDCLKVIYDGGDKLYVPVENIDVLSRYGTETAGVSLDKLGGVGWQNRKARLKSRIREMAVELIRIAAERKARSAEAAQAPEGLYDEFCARFPYVETEDQLQAIADTLEDLAAGRPMDRLVCGDVGFGKTEVALRAAMVAAMAGLQVAVVVPTTLLARQHFASFTARFAGLPVRIGQLSRMVPAKQATAVKAEMADGTLDIVVGTHALLSKSISFKRLGLLIVDEEQHFGVAHKERLKALKTDVHVLTLTATPIPRTLQMALTGVRELSLISTPPVDRLAVRTFVLPYDPVVIKEAIERERQRGGQIFYVCPRLSDIDRVLERLAKLVPEARPAVAHGQMAPTALEDVMTAFADGLHDILVCTNIIESGLDMPRVNTIIIHRADLFGLAQLYQLRGRVGRGKLRGYAYLTVPADRTLSKSAERRLHVMTTLDSLGAGFQLASHDLDIRGAGNLLGDEQSGHIKEVGVELYQQLLEEAVAAAKEGPGRRETGWSPQIALGTPVLIPDAYVPDLGTRLSLYRRIGEVQEREEVDGLAVELVDRFGRMPPEVANLLDVVTVKALCRAANVEKVDAGPKGAVLAFRDNSFPNPAGLVAYMTQQLGTLKLRPDQKLVCIRPWEDAPRRVAGVKALLEKLVELARAA